MADVPVVVLGGRSASTRIIYHALKQKLPITAVILENQVPTRELLRRRIKRLGWGKVAGQVLFQALAVRCLEAAARKRAVEIMRHSGLRADPIDPVVTRHVPSVNSDEAIALLRELNPKVVLVNGTRIISQQVLKSLDAVFINTHVGITPRYRGVHGGYWSLVEQNRDACGVTVHLVDSGIDSGEVLEQALISPTSRDNFTTYPLLQIAAAVPLVERAIRSALAGSLRTKEFPNGISKLWTHPTLGEYLWNRFRLGVK